MAKSVYRSEMGIMHEILSIAAFCGRDGVNVSKIASKANLSHYAVIDKCDSLIEAGLMEIHMNKRNRIFKMTEKGRMFFVELDRFQSLVNSLNLRC